MNINRPFFFAIRDDITETILFMGNVVDPQDP
jgi:serine protease inhibitor